MRRVITAFAALSLLAAPTASALAQARSPAAAAQASNLADDGPLASPVVLILAGLAVLVAAYLIFLDDDPDSMPASP
jgi:hypothetical protein